MSEGERIPCPVCGEMIVKDARVCRFCGEKFTPPAATEGDSTGGLIPYKNPPALIAYYCGLFSLLACAIPIFLPLPIVALVLGIKGLKKAKAEPHVRGKVHAWIGIVFGLVCTIVGTIMTVGITIAILHGGK
jgi:hypothetical protein